MILETIIKFAAVLILILTLLSLSAIFVGLLKFNQTIGVEGLKGVASDVYNGSGDK